jgi:hypothetical protein
LRSVADPLARDLYIDRLAQLLKVEPGLIKRQLRAVAQNAPRRDLTGAQPPVPRTDVSDITAHGPPPEAERAVPPRPIGPVLEKLQALLSHRATLIDRVTPALLDAIADPAVKALLAVAVERKQLVPRDLLEMCAPEIREAVARAFLGDEFAQVADAPRAFDEITARLRLPNDRQALEAARKAALAEGNHERVRELTARILSTRMKVQA